jgi:uncharacterized protein (DUF58 family)
VNTGNNLLFLLVAGLLAFMCSTGVAGWLNVRGLTIELLPPDDIYCQQPAVVRVRITNRKRRLPSFLLIVPVAGDRCAIYHLPPGGQAEQTVTCTFTNRGWHAFPPAWVQSAFPTGFFIRGLPAGAASNCLVLPQPIPAPLFGNWDRLSGSLAPLHLRGWDGDLRAITPYTGQEPRKLINWHLSARHDTLLVREFESLATEPVMIDLDATPATDLTTTLGRAVFLINRCWHEGRPVGLVANGVRFEPQHSLAYRRLLLREVALYGL